jgi:hypothetical protein
MLTEESTIFVQDVFVNLRVRMAFVATYFGVITINLKLQAIIAVHNMMLASF